MPCMAMYRSVDPREGVNVGALIKDTLREIDLQVTSAARIQDVNEATWTRALQGAAPLDLWRMRTLGWPFWRVFAPKFIAASFALWCQDRFTEWKERA